jgi:ribonuclease PH
MIKEKMLETNPLVTNIAAVSVGIIDGAVCLDLDYEKDSRADVDMNVVMNGNFDFIEIQGTGEQASFSNDQLQQLLKTAEGGIRELISIQNLY